MRWQHLHSCRVDRLRFGVEALSESEGADHCGGISLSCAWFCGGCTAQHQREQAERHFVPESEERHVVPLGLDCTLKNSLGTDFPPTRVL